MKFSLTVSTDLKSAWHSAIFSTHIEVLKRIFLLILLLFWNFEGNRARNGSKISKNKNSENNRKEGKEKEKRDPKSLL